MKRYLVSMIAAAAACFAIQTAEAIDLKKLAEKLKAKHEQKAPPPAAAPAGAQAAAPAPVAAPSIVCDASAGNRLCYSFQGAENSVEKVSKGNQMACKFMRGRYLASNTCPSSNLLGKCTVLQGQPKEYSLHYYAGGKIDLAKAKEDCANPKSGLHAQGAGVWTGP
jgi:hypothetical protein